MSNSLTQLAGVLGMMGSSSDGEALNAARLAEKLRLKMDKSWGDLLTPTNSNGGDTMMRAARAEARVAMLTLQLISMQGEIDKLRSGNGHKAKPKTARPRTGGKGKHALDQATEDRLIRELRAPSVVGLCASSVKFYTGWNTPKMSIRNELTRIARRRGFVLHVKTVDGVMFYRFA